VCKERAIPNTPYRDHLRRAHSTKYRCKSCRKHFGINNSAATAQRNLDQHHKQNCQAKVESFDEPEWMREEQEDVFDLKVILGRSSQAQKWKAIFTHLNPGKPVPCACRNTVIFKLLPLALISNRLQLLSSEPHQLPDRESNCFVFPALQTNPPRAECGYHRNLACTKRRALLR
jgi:hypothetical protein